MLVAMPIKEEKHSDKPKNNRQYKQGSSDSYVVIASGANQTLESAGSADISLQTASYDGTKR
jgi:hypothetical protein